MTNPLADHCSLVELLRWRAVNDGGRSAFTFLADGEHEDVTTYAELDVQARAIGGMLQDMDLEGERALLLYPPGPAYVAAFIGCLYAGVTAVPAYPPRANRPDPRIQTIAGDIDAAVVLTIGSVAQCAERVRDATPAMLAMPWHTTDDITDGGSTWRPPAYDENGLAFVQYTSGSTAAPRGVMVTHKNLLHNLEATRRRFEHTPESQGVIWLPPYHDMGLIGGILQPLFAGFPVALMPPAAFIQRPVRWLRAVSHYRATTSGGPDFAFDLCVRKVTAEERETLDLSSWQIAFSGAEPIRAKTIDRFVEAFRSCGFRREAFYPCYGLAEATLMASGGAAAAPPVVRDHPGGPRGSSLVGCGRAIPDSRLLVVDPHTLSEVGEREVGEIWIAGPSVAQGYWHRPGDTATTFHAHLADTGGGPYLRTGDLGFLDGGELFVTGRFKDLIVIRGRNYYPSDLEAAAEESHPALRPYASAVFTTDEGDEPKLVVVQELARVRPGDSTDEAIVAVRRAIADKHGLLAHTVLLVRGGKIARTSSGKIQRQACRLAYLNGALDVVASNTVEGTLPRLTEGTLDREALLQAPPKRRHAMLTDFLRAQWARALKVSASDVDPQQGLRSSGLDSLLAVDLKHLIEVHLGVVLPMSRFVDDMTLDDLATRLLEEVALPSVGEPALSPPAPETVESMWVRHTRDVGSLIAREVQRRPEAIAVIAGDDRLTFGDLGHRAARVTEWLQARGVGGEAAVVSIAAHRPAELVVGIVGILLAGAAFELAPAVDAGSTETTTMPADHYEDDTQLSPGMWLMPRSNAADGVETPVACVTRGDHGGRRAISHDDVFSFFTRLDTTVGCDPSDVLRSGGGEPDALSALEMLWVLTRGATITFASDGARAHVRSAARAARAMPFSLFYFSSDGEGYAKDKYRLLLEGASFADRHEFVGVWTPERHGHRFGGLYPNPSVLGAALAVTTQRVRIRAGSVVLPLHDPVRVAEEWSVVDNLSRGRVDVAFARGWNANDFIFAPDNYTKSAEVLFSSIETVQRLWRGESIVRPNGVGAETEYRIHPRPQQPELPVWVTCSGGTERFVEAGAIGANVLTALLFQSVDDLGSKIRLYRETRAQHGHDPAVGQVTVMLHTFVGERMQAVRNLVRQPFTEYLASSMDLWRQGSQRLEELSERERRDLLDFAFERYFGKAALLGTPHACAAMVEALRSVGVDEIACLIDFGVDADVVLSSLDTLNELRRLTSERSSPRERCGGHLPGPAPGLYQPTIVHCTADEAASLGELFRRGSSVRPPRVLLRGAGNGKGVEGVPMAAVRVVAEQDRRAWLTAGTAPTRDLADVKARLELLALAQNDAVSHDLPQGQGTAS